MADTTCGFLGVRQLPCDSTSRAFAVPRSNGRFLHGDVAVVADQFLYELPFFRVQGLVLLQGLDRGCQPLSRLIGNDRGYVPDIVLRLANRLL